jgi:tetratricopeptide (TPR) repeat protein
VTGSIHPEYLFDLERQASLTESERALRDQHLAACTTCRMEHGFRADFAREPLESPEDRAILERAVHGAFTIVSAPPKRPPSWAVPSAIGAGVLAAGLAAAALSGREAPLKNAAVPRSSATATLLLAVESAPVPTRSEPGLVADPPPARTPPRPAPVTAAQLFSRANAARRSGSTDEALRLYRRLASEFSSSREALTSQVTMARLLLDTEGDAAEALSGFESYVRAAPTGNLAEEAWLGRAEALGRLARGAEEAAAWSELLERFPATVHRGRAETRLRELGAASR